MARFYRNLIGLMGMRRKGGVGCKPTWLTCGLHFWLIRAIGIRHFPHVYSARLRRNDLQSSGLAIPCLRIETWGTGWNPPWKLLVSY